MNNFLEYNVKMINNGDFEKNLNSLEKDGNYNTNATVLYLFNNEGKLIVKKRDLINIEEDINEGNLFTKIYLIIISPNFPPYENDNEANGWDYCGYIYGVGDVLISTVGDTTNDLKIILEKCKEYYQNNEIDEKDFINNNSKVIGVDFNGISI